VNAIQTVQALVAAVERSIIGEEHAAPTNAALAAGRALLAQLQAGDTARPQTWDRDDIEAVISCLGDDAAQLRDENQEDERADNMDRAASMLTVFAMREYAAAPAVAQMPDALYDGYAVWQALDDRAKTRTSPENVSDVLDALARVAKNWLTLPEGGGNA
jgi:hypothetical protein